MHKYPVSSTLSLAALREKNQLLESELQSKENELLQLKQDELEKVTEAVRANSYFHGNVHVRMACLLMYFSLAQFFGHKN